MSAADFLVNFKEGGTENFTGDRLFDPFARIIVDSPCLTCRLRILVFAGEIVLYLNVLVTALRSYELNKGIQIDRFLTKKTCTYCSQSKYKSIIFLECKNNHFTFLIVHSCIYFFVVYVIEFPQPTFLHNPSVTDWQKFTLYTTYKLWNTCMIVSFQKCNYCI